MIGSRVSEWRERLEIDKQEFVTTLNRSRSWLDAVERDEAELKATDLFVIWETYGTKPSELLTGEIERDAYQRLASLQAPQGIERIVQEIVRDFVNLPPHAREAVTRQAMHMIGAWRELSLPTQPQHEFDLE